MLEAFDRALSDFEKYAFSALHQYTFDWSSRAFQIQIRAQSLASDVGYFAMVLRDMHAIAISHVSEDMDRENAEYKKYLEHYLATNPGAALDEKFRAGVPRNQERPMLIPAKLGTTFKAFFFFVRAYQDGLYRFGKVLYGMELKRDETDSMKSAISDTTRKFMQQNLVGDALRATCPDYPAWFIDMRELRNRIKDGIGVSYSAGKDFTTGQTTVGIQFRRPKSDDWPIVSLDTASAALSMSARATDSMIQVGRGSGKLTSKG